MEFLKQEPLTLVPKALQIIILALPFTTFFSDKTDRFVEKNKKVIIEAFLKHPQLQPLIKNIPTLKTDDELIKLLEGAGPILAKICQ